MGSDHTTWFETLRMMHTQAFLTARSHKEVWGPDFSLHGTGRHSVNLKVGILLPICPSKLYFQPCQGL